MTDLAAALMDAIAAALRERDLEGAVALMHELAAIDPEAAGAIMGFIDLAGSADA